MNIKVKLRNVFFVVVMIIIMVEPKSILASENTQLIKVLFINSHSMESEKETLLKSAIANQIDKYGESNFKFSLEYLDYKSIDDEELINEYTNFLEYKYKDDNIDYIYAINDEAFDFTRIITGNEGSIFYKKPVLFIGVNDNKLLSDEENQYMTGMYNNNEVTNLLNLINIVENDITDINLIISDNQLCNEMKEKILAKLPSTININVIQSYYIDDLKNTLSEHPEYKKNISIIAGEYFAVNDVAISSEKVMKELSEYLSSRIYTMNDIYIDDGIIGATITSVNDEAEFLVDSVYQIEKYGYSIANISTTSNYNEEVYLDYYAFKEKNLSLNELEESFKNFTFLNKDKYDQEINDRIISILKIIIGIIIIVCFYLFYNISKVKRKSKIEKEIMDERERLRIDFIAILSHEIRTPLNIIMNSANLIRKKVNDQDYIDEKVIGINNNSYRLLKLTNNILEIVKAEADLIELNFGVYNIVEVVEDVFQATVKYANKKNIDIVFDTEVEEIVSMIDKERFERVILNLLSNSIKFTQQGGVIKALVKKEEENTIIEITDNGIGVEASKVKDMFKKFSTSAPALTREVEGGGLGLSLVKKVIELHKGEIAFESKILGGTVVTIKLPIIKDDGSNNEIKSFYTVEELTQIEMSDLINY